MKKIFMFLAVAVIGCSALFICNGKKTGLNNQSKNKEFNVLLHKPKIDEGKCEYIVLNDFQNNTYKKSESKDFISGLAKSRSNPYNDKNYIHSYPSNIQSSYSKSDLLLMAKLIKSEAENQSYIGKIAVASVVMNRCRFNGKTISQTIYAPGQFDGVDTCQFNEVPSAEDFSAAREVLKGINVVPEAYYYANLKLCDPGFAKNAKFNVRIGDHWFFKR
ncbi:cell wall hydrolase [Clostridium oryzae]|nr:cell wall hydrolase [Clostridium oryzae]